MSEERMIETAIYEKNGYQITWDKSKKSKDIVETVNEDGSYTSRQSNGFHFFGSNAWCWRAYSDPHRVMQEIIDYSLHSDPEMSHGFLINLYMVPCPSDSNYKMNESGTVPLVVGTSFIGSFRVENIKQQENDDE
jgi:hypothetical protein